jgi:transcriptional regulator with XRE-family HTH domain
VTNQRRAGVEDIEIGRKIRTLRLERGLSQSRLADGIGLSFQQLQKYEKGTNRVSAGRLQKIAELLGVPVMVFYGVTGLRVKKNERRDDAFVYLQARGAVRVARAYAGISSRATKNALVVLVESLRDKDRA